ncbi:MAG: GAF domain-containing protein [Calothrix sp. FI2-JRJ7]|nr:GAF domain-containing protein [Calothrix sp. FI2-JRJ7]
MQLVEPCLGKSVDRLTKGKIQVINNVYQAGLNDCYLQLLESFNVKANLVVPIIVNNKLLGLLITHQCSHPRNWQQSEIDLCEQPARLISLALEPTAHTPPTPPTPTTPPTTSPIRIGAKQLEVTNDLSSDNCSS